MRIAMIAHDEKKIEMVRFATNYQTQLREHNIVATGTTGTRLQEFVKDLKIEKVASGPLGGDAQISSQIVEKKIDAVLFFIDPLSAHPHDPDINGLIRLCVLYNTPLALNYNSAIAIINSLHIDNQ
jgi:methylglyoxal synthase